MNRRFNPNLFRKKENNKRKKTNSHKTIKIKGTDQKQPKSPKIYTWTYFNPKPDDLVLSITVDTKKEVDLDKVRLLVCEAFCCDIELTPSLFGDFDVTFSDKQSWRVIKENMLKVLGAL